MLNLSQNCGRMVYSIIYNYLKIQTLSILKLTQSQWCRTTFTKLSIDLPLCNTCEVNHTLAAFQ